MFAISDLALGAGSIGICPAPGRSGDYAADLARLLDWRPDLVLSMTVAGELAGIGAGGLGRDLTRAGCAWCALPVADFGIPAAEALSAWPQASARTRAVLDGGGRVLVHCFGGCGRSGMAILRLMVESGEAGDRALARLRAVRPCAVETAAQMWWACAG